MNATKRWGIGLMVVGVMGVLVAMSVELPASDGQIDTRFFAALALNMALSPLVWVGAVGVVLWFSGSKKDRDELVRRERTEPPRDNSLAGASAPTEPSEFSGPLPAYPIPSASPAMVSGDLEHPAGGGFDRTGAIVGGIALVAVVGAIAFGMSRAATDTDPSGSSVIGASESTTTTTTTLASVEGTATTTVAASIAPGPDTSGLGARWIGVLYEEQHGSGVLRAIDSLLLPEASSVGGTLLGEVGGGSLVVVGGRPELWYSEKVLGSGSVRWLLQSRVPFADDSGVWAWEPQCQDPESGSEVVVAWRQAGFGDAEYYEAAPDRAWYVDHRSRKLVEVSKPNDLTCTFDHWDNVMQFPPGSVAALPSGEYGTGFDPVACTYDGVPLWGRVAIVDSLADFAVQIVESDPDLRVEAVDSFAGGCGEWRLGRFSPDFRVRFVETAPDFTVQLVGDSPGT